MKYILKLSLVLLVICSSCSRMYEYDENAQVIIHVGFWEDKMSHSGQFYMGLSETENSLPPVIKIPYYNGSKQEIEITGYSMPGDSTKYSVDGIYNVGDAEQGVFEIPVKGTTDAIGADTLIFFMETSTRTWTITYPIVITDPDGASNALEIVSATLDARVMRGVYVRSDEETGNKQISLNYINGYARKVLFTAKDPTGLGLFDVGIDKAISFLANSEAENNIILPLSSTSKYSGSDETVGLTVVATEYDLDDGSIVGTTEFVIEDIPTYVPAYLDYTVMSSIGDDEEIYAGESLTGSLSAMVYYSNGENRVVKVTGTVSSSNGGNEGVTVPDYSVTLGEGSGYFAVPIEGDTDTSSVLTISIYISGDAIDDALAKLPETFDVAIRIPVTTTVN